MIPALLGTFTTWALLSLPAVTEPQPPVTPPTAPEPEPVVESMSTSSRVRRIWVTGSMPRARSAYPSGRRDT